MTEPNQSLIVRVATEVTVRGIAGGFAAIKAEREPRPIHPRSGGKTACDEVGHLLDRLATKLRSARRDGASVPVGEVRSPLPDAIRLAFRFATE